MADNFSDRITELLTSRAPSPGDTAAAASRAAFGLESFGDAMTKMRASRLSEEKTLFDVLATQQLRQQQGEQLNLQRQRLNFDILKSMAERGDKNAEAVYKAVEFNVPDPSQRNAALLAVEQAAENVDATNAYSMVPQIIARAGISTAAPKKEGTASFGTVTTKNGVFAFDHRTGQMGQFLGDSKTPEKLPTQVELWLQEFLGLEEKAQSGPLTPQEARRHKALNFVLSKQRNIEGQGLVVTGPTGDGPFVVAPPTLKETDYNKLELSLADEQSSLRALDRYMEANKGPQGAEFVANKALGQLKAIFGGDLNATELNALRRTGQMNAILGRIREEVLGPGVLTEADAERLVSVLGGEPGLVTSRQAVNAALQDVMREKRRRVQILEGQMARAQSTKLGGAPAPVAPAQAPAPAPERKRIRFDAQGNPLP